MTDEAYLSFPLENEFLRHTEPKRIQIALSGHIALDGVLDVAIAESLANSDAIDFKSLGFLRKVELAIALGILPEDSKGAYVELNKVRNRAGHTLREDFERKSLLGSLSKDQRALARQAELQNASSDDLAAIMLLVSLLYRQLRASVEAGREKRLRAEARMDIEQELRMGANYGVSWGEMRRQQEEELARRVEEKKKARGYTYTSPSHGPPYEIDG